MPMAMISKSGVIPTFRDVTTSVSTWGVTDDKLYTVKNRDLLFAAWSLAVGEDVLSDLGEKAKR